MSALVTGASGGLGRAVAVALAAAGRDVAVHYRGDELGAHASAGGVERTGHRASTHHLDLDIADPDELDAACGRLLDDVEAALGPLDVVVLNAFPQQLTPWEALDTATWDAQHRGGLRASAALLRATLARLRPGGVAVTVGSVEGLRAAPDHAAYAVGKAAVHHLTAAAAAEVGPRGVRVVGVAPGLIARDGLERAWPEGVERWREASALRRPVTPEEVAAAVVFLASPAASGITGVVLPVDAGWSASPGW